MIPLAVVVFSDVLVSMEVTAQAGSRLTCDPIPDLTCDPILNPPKVASLTTLFPASLATLFLETNAKS